MSQDREEIFVSPSAGNQNNHEQFSPYRVSSNHNSNNHTDQETPLQTSNNGFFSQVLNFVPLINSHARRKQSRKIHPHSRGNSRHVKNNVSVSKFQSILDLKYQNKSLFLFSNQFLPRKLAIWITENVWFERLVLLLIIVNCGFLSIYDPLQEDGRRNRILEISEYAFQAFFTVEMCLKIFAQGLILHRNAYLRDYWSCLDALIVVTGFLGFFQMGNLSTLRAFRLLRPLRAVSGLKEMRVIINAVARSLPMLINALVLYFFFLLLYGIMAVQLFSGKLRSRCYHKLSNELYDADYLCGSQQCPFGYECLQQGGNPIYNLVSFDNIFWSALTLFTSITREDWVYRMYDISETTTPIIAHIFFLSLVLIGSYFIVNLNLVIISESFDRQLRIQKEKQKQEQLKKAARLREVLDPTGDTPEEEDTLQQIAMKLKAKEDTGTLPSPTSPSIPQIAVNDEILSPSSPVSQVKQNAPIYDATHAAPSSSTPITVQPSDSSARTQRVMDVNAISPEIDDTTLTELLFSFHFYTFFKRFTFFWRQRFSTKNIVGQLNYVYDALAVFFDNVPYQTNVRHFVRYIICSRLVTVFFTLLTILNTITLGIDYYLMPQEIEDMLIISNYVFIGLFTCETVFKFYGLGPKTFMKDAFNNFDAIIVFLSLVEIALPISSGFTVLRTFRLLRVFKLARFSENIQKLLRIVFNSVRGAFMLTILLALVIFIYALLGMQLFGGTYGPQNDWDGQEKPRFNYDSLDWALITTFVIVSAENWPTLMYQNMHANGVLSCVYFISLYVVGNALVLNLFIGLLLSQFENDEDSSSTTRAKKGSFSWKESFLAVLFFWRTRRRRIRQSFDKKYINQITDMQLDLAVNTDIRELERERKKVHEANDSYSTASINNQSFSSLSSGHLSTTNSVTTALSERDMDAVRRRAHRRMRKHRNFFMDRLLGDYSLFILGPNWLRRLLRRLVENRIFEMFILFLIVVSTVALVLEDPFLPPDAPMMRVLSTVNLILTILFTLEAMLKIFAMGFVFMKGAYLRSMWNVLDFVIVLVGILSRVFTSESLEIFKALRLLRTLRPLRFVNRLQGLKVVVDALLMSIPAIVNVLLFTIMNYIIFGIMGVNMLKGTFYSCSDAQWSNRELCEAAGATWRNTSKFHFDNIFNAVLTLFFMSTMEGYPTMLLRGVDSTEPEWTPVKNNRPYMSLYFIAYIIVGSFFMTNLFVGVLIDNYYTLKNSKKIGLLSEKQKEWVNMQRVLLDAKPEYKPSPPSLDRLGQYSDDGQHFHVRIWLNQTIGLPPVVVRLILEPLTAFRLLLFQIVSSSIFELFIMACIILNVITMSMEHYDMNPTFFLVLSIFNYVWTFIFVIEAILKLIAFGVYQYFRDWWNCFDFFICVVSVVGAFVSSFTTANSSFTSIFRLLRVGRLFRLLRVAQGIRQLLRTLFLSLPSLFNVSCLLLLLFFIYAVLGAKLFAKVRWTEEGITSQSNFRSFYLAMLLLFRTATGEDFHLIFSDAMVSPPNCSNKWGDCGDSVLAVAYFFSFILLAMFVLVNLFVAVILENFSSVINRDDCLINDASVQHFLRCWKRYDPELTLYMDANSLTSLILDLGEPLGFDPLSPQYNRHMRNLMRALADINHHSGNLLHYQEVLMRLARYKFGTELPHILASKYESKWQKTIPQAPTEPKYTVEQIYAAMKVQQYWRKRMMMRHLAHRNGFLSESNLFGSSAALLGVGDDYESDSGFSNLDSFNEHEYDPDVYNDVTEMNSDDLSLFSEDSDTDDYPPIGEIDDQRKEASMTEDGGFSIL